MTKSELTALIRLSPLKHQQGKNVLLAILYVAAVKQAPDKDESHWAVMRVRLSQKKIGLLAGVCGMTVHRQILNLLKLGLLARRRWEGKTWLVIREKKIQEMIKKVPTTTK